MSDLAAFLELVHTATTRWHTVTATGVYEADLDAVRSGAAKALGLAGLNFPPPPGKNATPTGNEVRRFGVSARGREFVRVEQTGEQHTIAIVRPDGTATCNSDGEWSFEAKADSSPGAIGRMPIRFGFPVGGPQSFGMLTMLDPSSLLGPCRFDSASTTVIDGRSAFYSIGRPIPVTFPPGLGAYGLHLATTSLEITVDRETGIVLRLCEYGESGLLIARTLRIESVDAAVDEANFAMPSHVEDTKESRATERFDDPASLSASVSFGVYHLDPSPTNCTVLCMRESLSSARITYLGGLQSVASKRLIQPISVKSSRSKGGEPQSPGDTWEPVSNLGVAAWSWTSGEGDQVRSHVRISFGDADVELSCELAPAEALQLATTLHRA